MSWNGETLGRRRARGLGARWAALLLSYATACGGGVAPGDADVDGAIFDAATDGMVFDSAAPGDGAVDSGAMDSGAGDSGMADSGAGDSGTADSGAVDSGTADTGAIDSGAADSGAPPAPAGTFESVFSHRPTDDGRDTAIEDRIVSLVDSAARGSRIRVALFSFTRNGVADALNAAAARGVDVKVLLDGGADGLGSEVSNLRSGLGLSRVHLCDAPGTACIGTGIMHHKTFLFSELRDGTTNVVVQASHNMTTQMLHEHNDALIVRGDATLFAAYERTFDDLWADVEDANYYHEDPGALRTRAYFFPRARGGADPVVTALRSVRCDGSSRIRLVMAFFTDGRRDVAQELASRAREGCDVRAVIGTSSIPIGSSVRTMLTDGGVRLTLYPARGGGWALHSKYLAIDAPFEGSAGHRKLVFTGSENYTSSAFHDNDESMLRVEDNATFNRYLTNFGHVRASAARR